MARSRSRRDPSATEAAIPEAFANLAALPSTTGRWLVTYRKEASATAARAMNDLAGVRALRGPDPDGTLPPDALHDADVKFDDFGIAVVTVAPRDANALALADEDTGLVSVRPEFIMVPLMDGGYPAGPVAAPGLAVSADYLRGLRDGAAFQVNGLLASLLPPGYPVPPAVAVPTPFPPGIGVASATLASDHLNASQTATWGLEEAKVLLSPLSGAGVRVAVLDTGLDLSHPDFVGRSIQPRSFAKRADGALESVQDTLGHGTHVVGTACGPKSSGAGFRYGVAFEAEIFVGKVFNSAGQAPEANIIAAIQWAVNQGCRIVSMSLGIPWTNLAGVPVNMIQQIVQTYESISQEAIRPNPPRSPLGTAIIAAAGNDCKRLANPPVIFPVAIPALASKIMAVGAVDRNLRIAPFSNRGGLAGTPGAVDLVGPGVNVFSAWPFSTAFGNRYNVISGTSMATPHVAGIATLIAEARPDWTAADILNTLMGMARPLDLSSLDGGRGLVQAFQQQD